MASRQASGLRQLVSEAARASLAERDKQMALLACPPEGPPWPYIIGDRIAARVSREQGPLSTSQAQLVRRLRAFRYPYVATHPYAVSNRKGKTFFAHVQSLGLLQFLLNPPFLWEVRRVWFFRRHYDLEMELRRKRLSQYGYPVSFHNEMMLAISTHLNKISKIANRKLSVTVVKSLTVSPSNILAPRRMIDDLETRSRCCTPRPPISRAVGFTGWLPRCTQSSIATEARTRGTQASYARF